MSNYELFVVSDWFKGKKGGCGRFNKTTDMLMDFATVFRGWLFCTEYNHASMYEPTVGIFFYEYKCIDFFKLVLHVFTYEYNNVRHNKGIKIGSSQEY